MLVYACVCLAKHGRALEPLAAASDSVSSSTFIRSASRRCHLSFPHAYITHAFAGPVDHRPCALPRGRSGLLAGLCSVRAGRERTAGTAFPSRISLNGTDEQYLQIWCFVFLFYFFKLSHAKILSVPFISGICLLGKCPRVMVQELVELLNIETFRDIKPGSPDLSQFSQSSKGRLCHHLSVVCAGDSQRR